MQEFSIHSVKKIKSIKDDIEVKEDNNNNGMKIETEIPTLKLVDSENENLNVSIPPMKVRGNNQKAPRISHFLNAVQKISPKKWAKKREITPISSLPSATTPTTTPTHMTNSTTSIPSIPVTLTKEENVSNSIPDSNKIPNSELNQTSPSQINNTNNDNNDITNLTNDTTTNNNSNSSNNKSVNKGHINESPKKSPINKSPRSPHYKKIISIISPKTIEIELLQQELIDLKIETKKKTDEKEGEF